MSFSLNERWKKYKSSRNIERTVDLDTYEKALEIIGKDRLSTNPYIVEKYVEKKEAVEIWDAGFIVAISLVFKLAIQK